VLIVGQGEIGRHARGVATADPRLEVRVCNRSADPAHGVLGLDRLGAELAHADAALLCTAAPAPVVDAALLAGRDAARPLLLVDLGVPEQVAAGALPPTVQRVGLDELVEFARQCAGPACARSDEGALIDRALDQFARFCAEPQFLSILEAVQAHKDWLAREGVQDLVHERFGDLPADLQKRLQQDLRQLLQRYSHGVVEAIREAADPAAYRYVDDP
jgi:glutamyl-tRNA reductase